MGKNKSKKKAKPASPPIEAMDVVLSLLPAVFFAGLRMFAGACEHADGSVVACATAGRTLMGLGVLGIALVLMRLLGADRATKRSFDLFLVIVGILMAALPGNVLALCVGEGMRCRTIMLPFARVMGIALAAVALACELTVDHEEPTGRRRRR